MRASNPGPSVSVAAVADAAGEVCIGVSADAVAAGVGVPSEVSAADAPWMAKTESPVERGQLTLSTHEDLPFGLAIFDDRIGLGGYDPDSGMLRVFVDTDDPDAREWALQRYERYREAADVVAIPKPETT